MICTRVTIDKPLKLFTANKKKADTGGGWVTGVAKDKGDRYLSSTQLRAGSLMDFEINDIITFKKRF